MPRNESKVAFFGGKVKWTNIYQALSKEILAGTGCYVYLFYILRLCGSKLDGKMHFFFIEKGA